MSAETGFLRIHYDSNQKPDWFPQVKIELQPTQNNGAAAASSGAAAAKPAEGGRPLDVKAFNSRLGVWMTLAATVLFAISVGTEEWLSTQAEYVPLVVNGTASENMGMVANLRRGLWTVCAKPVAFPGGASIGDGPNVGQCQHVDSDCSADFTFGMWSFRWTGVGRGDCAQYRAVRAFALLSVFAAGFAYFAQSHASCCGGKSKGMLKALGAFLGLSSGILGMITMSLARNYFGLVAFHEYGLAFWLNVIAWPLALFATIAFLVGNSESAKVGRLQTKFQLFAFIFFIVAVTTNEMTYVTSRTWPMTGAGAVDLANTTAAQFEAAVTFKQTTWGLWETYTYQSKGGVTDEDPATNLRQSIDDSCMLDQVDPPVKVGKCDSFRTIRTFLIISTVASFFTFVLVAGQTFGGLSESKTVQAFAVLSNWLVAGSSFLVIIISIDWFEAPTNALGFSFWLIVLGHAVTGLAMILQIMVDPKGVANFRNMIAFLFGFSAFSAFLAAVIMAQWTVVDTVPLYADKWSSGARTTYGLWRICKAGSECVDIDTDTTCGVNNGDGADFANCHHFNAVRAFAILATIAAFGFVHKALHNILHNEAGKCKALVVFGWATTVFGFIATALAASYYGVSAHEFGLSFWLFFTAWLGIFIATVYHQGQFFDNECLALSVLVSLVVLIFYILAASTSQVIRFDMAVSSPTSPMDRLTVHQGFFYRCFKTGEDQRCRFIQRDCSVVKFPYITENPLRDCAQFNGIRATGMLALTFQAIGFLAQISFAHGKGGKAARALGWAAPAFASFWGLISMAAALTYYSDMPTSTFGHGMWLLTIAWVLGAFGSSAFCCSACNGGECCKKGECCKDSKCCDNKGAAAPEAKRV